MNWRALMIVVASLLASCSGPDRVDEPVRGESAAGRDAGSLDGFADGGVPTEVGAEPVFGAKLRVRTLDFSMLGPSDVVPLDDEHVYVLLSSASGTKTGRPMAVVDVASGEVTPTSAAPIPLTRPYGVPIADEGMIVWNLATAKHQPDLFYLETLHYDRGSDLWRVVPPPDTQLVQLADVETDAQGRAHLDLVGANEERSRFVFDVDKGVWSAESDADTDDCMTSQVRDDAGVEWHTGARFRDTIEPCAYKLVDGAKEDLPTPPSARCLHVVVRGTGTLWNVGGYESCGESKRPTSEIVDRLSDDASKWERLPALPHPVYPSGTLAHKGKLYVFDQKMRIFSFDERAGDWAVAEPAAGLENNSDWTVISNDRVVALAWEEGSKRTVNKLVVVRFR